MTVVALSVKVPRPTVMAPGRGTMAMTGATGSAGATNVVADDKATKVVETNHRRMAERVSNLSGHISCTTGGMRHLRLVCLTVPFILGPVSHAQTDAKKEALKAGPVAI